MKVVIIITIYIYVLCNVLSYFYVNNNVSCQGDLVFFGIFPIQFNFSLSLYIDTVPYVVSFSGTYIGAAGTI